MELYLSSPTFSLLVHAKSNCFQSWGKLHLSGFISLLLQETPFVCGWGGGGGGVVCKVNTIQSETQVIFLLLFFPLFISCSSGSILEIILGNFIHKGLIIKRRKRMFNLFVSYPVQVQCSLSTGNWLGNGLIPASPLSL